MASVDELSEWLMSMGCGPMPTTTKNKAVEHYYRSALLHLKEKFQDLKPVKHADNEKKETRKKKLLVLNDEAENGLLKETRNTRKLGLVTTHKTNEKQKTAVKEDAKTAKPLKKAKKEQQDDLTDALDNMKIQGDKGCSCKGDCKTKICGCQRKGSSCVASCKCSAQCVNKVVGKVVAKVLEKAPSKKVLTKKAAESAEESDSEQSFDSEQSECEEPEFKESLLKEESDDSFDDEPLANLRPTSMDDTQELGKEEVDWEKHLAKLVSCPKCSRKFFARRLEKHVEVCKKI